MTAHALQRNLAVAALPAMRLVAGNKLSADEIYPHLFEAIVEQRIVPTSRFTEDSLAQDFGVSRSVVRRVLARLAEQHVIILRPNLRAQVAAPDLGQVQHILEARRLMEVTVVQLACAQATATQVRQLRELIARQREACEREQTGAAIRLAGEFHLSLAQIAGNRPLAQFLNSLVPLTALVLGQRGQHPGDWREQLRIVDAIERGDVGAATTLMTRHLDHLHAVLSR